MAAKDGKIVANLRIFGGSFSSLPHKLAE